MRVFPVPFLCNAMVGPCLGRFLRMCIYSCPGLDHWRFVHLLPLCIYDGWADWRPNVLQLLSQIFVVLGIWPCSCGEIAWTGVYFRYSSISSDLNLSHILTYPVPNNWLICGVLIRAILRFNLGSLVSSNLAESSFVNLWQKSCRKLGLLTRGL